MTKPRTTSTLRICLIALLSVSITAVATGWAPAGWVGDSGLVGEIARRVAAPRFGFGGTPPPPPSIAPTMTGAIVGDADSDAKADPGDTIRYTTTIPNTGTDATSVQLVDTLAPNTTLVGGSIVISPLAINESYNSVGNMTLTSSAIAASCGANPLRSVTCNDSMNGAAVQYAGTAVSRRVLRIDADEEVEAEIDPRLTSSALAHVLENAAQYSPPDATVEIRGWVADGGLHFTVRDHGFGLATGELDQLFERFFRGTSGGRHAAGTGMGLAITRGLLAAQGGRVQGENAAGGGACFTIAVPGRSRAIAPQEA